MSNYQTWKIGPKFCVRFEASPGSLGLSDVENELVDKLWTQAQKFQGLNLFNGKLLGFHSLNNEELVGKFVDYKFYRAQLMDPTIKARLNIEPIAISCLTWSANNVLVGKRSSSVSAYPDLLEFVPSGGIDPSSISKNHVDIHLQSLKELEEESGITSSFVKSCSPLALIYDQKEEQYEIVLKIELNESKKPLAYRSLEYSELVWMDREELLQLSKEKKELFLPFSLYLMDQFL